MVCPLPLDRNDRGEIAGGPAGRVEQEGKAMKRLRGTARAQGFQSALVKLALSFGMILWMFVAATLSHA